MAVVELVARLVVEDREEVLLLEVMFAIPPTIMPSVAVGSLVLGPEIVTPIEAARRVAAEGVGNEKVAERASKEDEASALAVAWIEIVLVVVTRDEVTVEAKMTTL